MMQPDYSFQFSVVSCQLPAFHAWLQASGGLRLDFPTLLRKVDKLRPGMKS
jgi:hypothetical protein